VTSTKKTLKRLAKLRAKQHRRLLPTGYAVVPIGKLPCEPEVQHPLRTERVLRTAAEEALTEAALNYIKAKRDRALRAEASGVIQAIELTRQHHGSAMRERAIAALGDAVPLPRDTDEVENSLELYVSLVAAADWVADTFAAPDGTADGG